MNNLIASFNELAASWWSWVSVAGWQSAWVGLAILLVVWIGKRLPSPLRYSLLLIAALKFVVPAAFVAPTSIWSAAGVASPATTAVVAEPQVPDLIAVSTAAPLNATSPPAKNPLGAGASTTSPRAAQYQATAVPAASGISAQPSLSHKAWLLLVALGGTLLSLLWIARQWLSIKRTERSARPANQELQASLAQVCEELGLRRQPKLLITSQHIAPNACGLLRPKILIPEAISGLSQREIACVLAHEVTHHQRGDILVNAGLWLIQAIWWFHPVVWLVGRSTRRVREECCDDRLIDRGITQAEDYCDTLLRTLAFCSASKQSAMAAGIGRHPLGGRFVRILDSSLTRSSRLSILGCISLLSAAALVLPGAVSSSAVTQADAQDAFFLSGTVVDHEGQPQAGVKLLYTDVMNQDFQLQSFRDAGVSDEQGKFRIAIERSQLNLPREVEPALCAFVAGSGIAWYRARERESESGIRLVLEPELTFTGKILSLEGQPLAGATIRPIKVYASTDGKLDTWLAHVKAKTNRSHKHLRPRISLLPDMGICEPVVTDEQGKFQLHGFAKDCVIEVVISGPKTQATIVRLVNRRMPEFKVPDAFRRNSSHYGIPAQILVAPTRLITGRVTDALSGQPLADIEIFPVASPGYADYYLRTRTDKDGRYSIAGLKINARPSMRTADDFARGYLSAEKRAPKKSGTEPVEVDLKLHRGVTVTGKVTDTMGIPVPEAFVSHASYPSTDGTNPTNMAAVRESRTGLDGKYRVLARPGKGVLRFRAGDKYLPLSQQDGAAAMMEIATKVNASPGRTAALYQVDLNIESSPAVANVVLHKGQEILATIVDEEGREVRGAEVYRVSNRRRWDPVGEDKAEVLLKAINPKQPRSILALQRQRGLAGRLTIAPNGNGTIIMKRAGRITGKFVDVDGVPRAGERLSISALDLSKGLEIRAAFPDGIKTDEKGEFTLPCCLPELRYTIMTASTMKMMPGGLMKHLPPIELANKIKVNAGATVELGTIKGRQL